MKTFYLPERTGNVTALAWSPDGEQIAAACEKGWAIVWSVSTGDVVFCRRVAKTQLLTVSWTENGHCLALGGENNAFTIIQLCDGALVVSQVFDAPVKKIAFAPRGGRFLVASGKTIYIYYGQWRAPVTLKQSSPVLDIAWSPTGGRFAAVCGQGDVFVYNVVRRRLVYTLFNEDISQPCSVAWNTDGRDVAVGTAKGTIQMHDGTTGRCFTTYALSSDPISQLSWGNPCLAALDGRAEITLWDVLPREHSGMLAQRYPAAQQALAFSPNGAQIATCTQHICVMPVG